MWRVTVAVVLLGLCGGSGLASASGGREIVQDEVTAGLGTTDMLEADPAGFRVTWIKWNSGFRGTGLQIGDRIIAVNGQRYVRPAKLEDLQRMLSRCIGQYAENQFWNDQHAKDGSQVTLTVQRRAPTGVGVQRLDVSGKLRADRLYLNDQQRHTIGPGGPDELGRDQFDTAWSWWYEAQTREWERILDRGWTQHQMDSRMDLTTHLDEKARVDFLVAHYPGPFAATVRDDWERVRVSLLGRRYTIADKDLQYRRLGEQRAAEITAAGKRARQAFLDRVHNTTIPAFPAIDPIRGDRGKVAGKLVVLPVIGPQDWISEAGHCYLGAGEARGWYFIDCDAPETQRMFMAMRRYQRYVQPHVTETFAIVGRIAPDPKMLVVNGSAIVGLGVVPVAATIGDEIFVDLTVVKGQDSPFAGEAALDVPHTIALKDTATPRQVMEAFVAALKAGEQNTWQALFASWDAEDWQAGGTLYYPYFERRLDDEWVRARRLILDPVYQIAVIYVSDPRRIVTGKEFPKAPVIDEVSVEVDHVGKFDGEYHAFVDVNVHRVWLLQRRDGGPWRIAMDQGI